MKILVTGATGFIGKHLVKRLITEGHKLKILIRKGSDTTKFSGLGVEPIVGNLADLNSLKFATKNVDLIIHLAGLIHPVNVPNKLYWDVNVYGTENLIRAAIRNKVKRFIYCSSVTCYGSVDNEDRTIIDENYPCHSQNIYGLTKYEGENVCWRYSSKIGVTIIRPSRVYGPGDLTLLPLVKLINKHIFFRFSFKKTYMIRSVGERYIIAGAEIIDKITFMNIISKVLKKRLIKIFIPKPFIIMLAFFIEITSKPFGVEPFLSRKKLKFFLMSRKYNIEKAIKELGYYPRINIEEGIKRAIEWYKERGYIS